MASKIVRFTCPQCQKRLKTNRPVEAGQKTSCPFCGCVLALPMPEVGPGASNIIQAYVPKSEQQPSPGTPQQPARYPAPAQAAKNPLIYALGGALLMLLLGGGIWAAYNAGRENAQTKANGNQVVQANPTESKTPPTRPTTPQSANPKQPATTTSKPNSGNTTSATKPKSENAPQQPKPAAPPVQPKPKPRDDSNRPKQNTNQPAQPQATINPPLIVEVPVFIPLGDIHSSRRAAKPDLQVLIRPKDSLHTIPTLDHLTPPGLESVLLVRLDKNPKATVTVNVTNVPAGLKVTPTILQFSPNVGLVNQELTITADGNPDMPSGPVKLFYIELIASGGGLQADRPARIPVKVRRRDKYQTKSGILFTRSTTPLTDWTRTPQGDTFTGLPYEDEYIELSNTSGLKFRLYDDHIKEEVPPGSGKFVRKDFGSWK